MALSSIIVKLRAFFGVRTAARIARENPVFQVTVSKASEIYSRIPLGQYIDDATKNALARRLYLELNEICNATEPKVVCRDKLVRAMLTFAPLQVVMIPPPPSDDASGLRALPGITGELQSRLDELVRNGVFFRPETEVALRSNEREIDWSSVQRFYWEAYWFLETFNAARIELGDTIEAADWYKPFMHAACVSQEHIYRRELNLPPAFDEDVAQRVVTAFSMYTDVVVSGAEDPDQEWQAYCAAQGVAAVRHIGQSRQR